MAEKISYGDALLTLESMFAYLDRELITNILKSNGGHMENTIDQLLQLSTNVDDEQASFLQEETLLAQETFDETNLPNNNWEDELNYEDVTQKETQQYLDEQMALKISQEQQLIEDEALAKLLQDNMFVNQIRQHPEFENMFADSRPQQYPFNESGYTEEDPTWKEVKEKVNQMSEMAKFKFKTLANKFSQVVQTPNDETQNVQKKYSSLQEDLEDDGEEELLFNKNSVIRRNNQRNEVWKESDNDIELEMVETDLKEKKNL